ncbi:MAG: aldehyde dehydrogenase family protein [Myxococcales bacterium]|nr:aldehyde dehydrogenase family protein [Myxococcales bacterium]
MTAPSLSPILDPQALAQSLGACHVIDGQLVPASAGGTLPVYNPATLMEIAAAAAGDAADVDIAARSAAKAQKLWAKEKPRDRGKAVAACGALLTAHVEELGRLTALETGKAIRTESRVEANVLADVFVYFGGLGSELAGETIPFSHEMLTFTLREPVGVVGAIIPWNAPLLLMALKVAPALVAGNSVVVKASEEAPFGVLRVCQLMQQALPPGVFNLVVGDGPTCGAALAEHPAVRKLTFTGSVASGRSVYRAAAEKLIPVTLELGGKSPMIVMADADLDKAVAGAVGGMRFTRQGQSCSAASRMFVQRPLHDRFVAALCDKVNAMVMGDPMEEATDIGTIISKRQLARVQSYIDLGQSLCAETEGAKAHICSQLPADPAFSQGLFVRPVIFTGLPNDSRIAQEEIFGPVTMVIPFDTYEEALEMANDSEFGLAATIWTTDLATAMDATHRLEAGFVQVNQNLVVQPMLSYGGVKASGLGKEASLQSMLAHFTHKKTVLINMGR